MSKSKRERSMYEGGRGRRTERFGFFFGGWCGTDMFSDEFAGEKENLGKGTFRERPALFCFASRRRPDPYHSDLTYRREREERASFSILHFESIAFSGGFLSAILRSQKNGGKFKSEVLCLAFEMFITRFLRICHLMTRTLSTPSIPFRASASITLSVSMRV